MREFQYSPFPSAPKYDAATPEGSTKLWRAVIIISCGSLSSGYSYGIVSGSIPLMARDLNLTTVQGETIASINCGVAALGAIFGGYIADMIGRRLTTTLPGLFMVGGSLVMASSTTFTTLLAGRFASGLAVGLGLVVYPIYVAELSPPDLRGQLGSYSELFWSWGMLAAFVVSYLAVENGLSWRFMVGLGAVPGFILTIGSSLLPESPYTHIANGRIILAAKVIRECSIELKKLRQPPAHGSRPRSDEESSALLNTPHGSNSHETSNLLDELVQERLHEIESTVVEATSVRWSDVFTNDNLGRLMVTLGLAFSQQITGIIFIEFYCTTILYRDGLATLKGSMLWTIGLGVIKLILVYVLGRVVDTMGRRPPLLISGVGVTLSNIGIGLSIVLDPPLIVQAALVLFWAYAFVAAYSFGYGPICNILTSEIYPTKTRARATSIGAVCGQISAFVVAMSFVTITENIGLGATFFLFGVVGACTTIFSYTQVPETKGKTLEEVTQLFERRNTRSRMSLTKHPRVVQSQTESKSYSNFR